MMNISFQYGIIDDESRHQRNETHALEGLLELIEAEQRLRHLLCLFSLFRRAGLKRPMIISSRAPFIV